MAEHVVAVDGGNSKTDVVIASTTGRVLARVRGPGVVSPLGDPVAWRDRLATLVGEAATAAKVRGRPACAAWFLANLDLPAEFRTARRELAGLADRTVVRNDTMAVLRAGASRGWGVAVVSGAGINAVGVHPSGRTTGFLALGTYSGDRGGGLALGVAALAAAARSRDGRGPDTVLARTVPAAFGLQRPKQVVVAVHAGTVPFLGLHVLAPVLFAAAAEGDAVATELVGAFADEVAVMATALIRRLRLTRTDVEVVLGGGTLQTGSDVLHARVAAGVTAVAPRARVCVLDAPPVFGAVAEAWSAIGAAPAALRRIRRTLVADGAARVG